LVVVSDMVAGILAVLVPLRKSGKSLYWESHECEEAEWQYRKPYNASRFPGQGEVLYPHLRRERVYFHTDRT
jgi:hypothetical protein